MDEKKLKENAHRPVLIAPLRIGFYSLGYFVLLHTTFYCIEQLHCNFCTPFGWSGFIQSFFTSQSTICTTLKVLSWHASLASLNMMSLSVSLIGALLTNSFYT